MKLQITGASNFVNRMFAACGSYQWAREFLKNALEAGATRVEFGIEWQGVAKEGVYRRTVADNGAGMDRNELLRFFSTLGEGAKQIGGVHDNFGVGAKIAALPWNPEGVVVLSYKSGVGSMIWIVLDEQGDYELVEFDRRDGTKGCVTEPTEIDGFDWRNVAPAWVRDHGTVVVLLGSEECPDTVLGNPHAGEEDIKGLSVYLNSRFWDLSGVEVRVAELRSDKKNQWPESASDTDDARRPNNRRIEGARHFLSELKSPKGRLGASGVLSLAKGRVRAEWYLWSGERPAIHSYAKRTGYIAVRYGDELYQLSAKKADFRAFGVIESKVQQNLTLVLEPQHYGVASGRWGVHPDQSRNTLIFSGEGEKGVALPLGEWGREFAEQMPEEIREALREARGDAAGSITDEEYRKRLQDKFGARWSVKRLVLVPPPGSEPTPATEADDAVEVTKRPVTEREVPRTHQKARRRRKKRTVKLITLKTATPGGEGQGTELELPVDVPKYRYVGKDSFDKVWHLALWAPQAPEGPTVLLNRDSPILEEIIQYHQAQHLDVYAEDVADTVRKVFGEVAVSKVAHAQKLTRLVPEEELDRDYRDEAALTVALMGLLAEEAVIAQRLTRLGKKRTSPSDRSDAG